MKIGNLKSLGHNLADSLASGLGLMIGLWRTDIFGEAAAGNEGYIVVDFLNGTTLGSPVSESLQGAVKRYSEILPEYCAKHNIDHNDIHTLKARFGTDRVYGRHFTVSVVSADGRKSTDQYYGAPGKSLRQGHKHAAQ